MPDARPNSDGDRPHAARAQRGEAALFAQYIHELSDRHNGSGGSRPAAGDGERATEAGREEGG